MGKESKNPFAIKQSPVRIITAQAVSIDDYVARSIGQDPGITCLGSTPK